MSKVYYDLPLQQLYLYSESFLTLETSISAERGDHCYTRAFCTYLYTTVQVYGYTKCSRAH